MSRVVCGSKPACSKYKFAVACSGILTQYISRCDSRRSRRSLLFIAVAVIMTAQKLGTELGESELKTRPYKAVALQLSAVSVCPLMTWNASIGIIAKRKNLRSCRPKNYAGETKPVTYLSDCHICARVYPCTWQVAFPVESSRDEAKQSCRCTVSLTGV